MNRILLAIALAACAGSCPAGENKPEAPAPFSPKSGVVLGKVAAVDKTRNEITVGGKVIRVTAADSGRLVPGDEVTVNFREGRASVRKAGEKEPPQPFKGIGYVAGRVAAVDAAKNEIVIGSAILSLPPADIARLKPGDEVGVSVNRGGSEVRKAGERRAPRAFGPRTGVLMGPVSSADAKTGEVTVGEHIVRLTPAEAAGLKPGDEVTFTFRNGVPSLRPREK